MLCTKFTTSVKQLRHANILLRRQITPEVCTIVRKNKSTSFRATENMDEDVDDMDKPIKYSTSEAAKWRVKPLPDQSPPWYQGLVVSASLAVFLLYFTILREENDIDEHFDKLLTTHFAEHKAQVYTPNTKNNLPKQNI